MSRVCLVCGAPLEQPEVGRPPSYCGEPCRRAMAYELRRLDKQIDDLERYQRSLRLMGTEERQQQRIQGELEAMQARMRVLLNGDPRPVSPHG